LRTERRQREGVEGPKESREAKEEERTEEERRRKNMRAKCVTNGSRVNDQGLLSFSLFSFALSGLFEDDLKISLCQERDWTLLKLAVKPTFISSSLVLV